MGKALEKKIVNINDKVRYIMHYECSGSKFRDYELQVKCVVKSRDGEESEKFVFVGWFNSLKDLAIKLLEKYGASLVDSEVNELKDIIKFYKEARNDIVKYCKDLDKEIRKSSVS